MLKEIKKDLKNLVEDVEKYILEEEKMYLVSPLKYRLDLIKDKYEKCGRGEVFGKNETIEDNLAMMEAVLY